MRKKHFFFLNFKMSYLRVKKLRKIGKTVITKCIKELHGLFSLVRVPTGKIKIYKQTFKHFVYFIDSIHLFLHSCNSLRLHFFTAKT